MSVKFDEMAWNDPFVKLFIKRGLNFMIFSFKDNVKISGVRNGKKTYIFRL